MDAVQLKATFSRHVGNGIRMCGKTNRHGIALAKDKVCGTATLAHASSQFTSQRNVSSSVISSSFSTRRTAPSHSIVRQPRATGDDGLVTTTPWGSSPPLRAFKEELTGISMFNDDLPTQLESVTTGGVTVVEAPRPTLDVDYLQELLAIQQEGARNLGFFGTRNMGFMHQQLIEILSYAMIITNNHIYTSGAAGTNAAVIRGALRAERPDLLTVILPQSLSKQPAEAQELLKKVEHLIEMPHNDHLPLLEASRVCNMDILSHVQQVICFAFHDSRLLLETCQEAKSMRKIVTLFYLD